MVLVLVGKILNTIRASGIVTLAKLEDQLIKLFLVTAQGRVAEFFKQVSR
jgi:hypothetical protein